MLRPVNFASKLLIDNFGIAIKRGSDDSTHCGIIFRSSTNGPHFLIHLTWAFDLRIGPLDDSYFFSLSELESSDQKTIAALCASVSCADMQIPYGFDLDGIGFDPVDGKLIVKHKSSGLTCATFVIRMLESIGYYILNRDEWPIGANEEWARSVIKRLKKSRVDKVYIKMLESDIASVRRFRPEEVAGSTPIDPWPVGFEDASLAANAVIQMI